MTGSGVARLFERLMVAASAFALLGAAAVLDDRVRDRATGVFAGTAMTELSQPRAISSRAPCNRQPIPWVIKAARTAPSSSSSSPPREAHVVALQLLNHIRMSLIDGLERTVRVSLDVERHVPGSP